MMRKWYDLMGSIVLDSVPPICYRGEIVGLSGRLRNNKNVDPRLKRILLTYTDIHGKYPSAAPCQRTIVPSFFRA
jgi:hypothetical protein